MASHSYPKKELKDNRPDPQTQDAPEWKARKVEMKDTRKVRTYEQRKRGRKKKGRNERTKEEEGTKEGTQKKTDAGKAGRMKKGGGGGRVKKQEGEGGRSGENDRGRKRVVDPSTDSR
jgi:hypothetical protein